MGLLKSQQTNKQIINTVDIDGLIDEFLNQASIKRALSSIEE